MYSYIALCSMGVVKDDNVHVNAYMYMYMYMYRYTHVVPGLAVTC